MFDTSYATQNMGDYIINDSINSEMEYLLCNSFVTRYPTHTPLLRGIQNIRNNQIIQACKEADYKFLCGTNIFKYNLFYICPDCI